jgi:tetratricopeptide (TPR) repeat protein
MFELKRLHRNAVPAALARAERYRLLNEAREAESIARDILAVDPENHEAHVLLILALTDQFPHHLAETWAEAEKLVGTLRDPHAAAYYRGILHERRAKTRLKAGRVGSRHGVYDDLRHAMELFEKAAAFAPEGDDSALLRWNTCARVLNSDPSLQPIQESTEPSMLE